MANAGLVDFQRVWTRTDTGTGVIHAAIGLYHQVVIGHEVGKVSVADAQFNDQVVAVDLHVFDAAHDAQRT